MSLESNKALISIVNNDEYNIKRSELQKSRINVKFVLRILKDPAGCEGT